MPVVGSTMTLSATASVPAPDVHALPKLVLGLVDAQDLELALSGVFSPGPRYLAAAERQAVREGRYAVDGTGWELPLALRLPRPVIPDGVTAGQPVVLLDEEGVPLAILDVTERSPEGADDVLAGTLTRVGAPTPRSFAALTRTAADVAAECEAPVLAVPTASPLSVSEAAVVAETAWSAGCRILLLALAGRGWPGDAERTVRSLLALVESTGTGGVGPPEAWSAARVRVLLLPRHRELSTRDETRLVTRIAAAHGAARVLFPAGRGWDDGALDSSLPVPAAVASAVAGDAAEQHGSSGRGITLFFTGLSGAGKSTVASAVAAAVAESGAREVSLLDGDHVRTLLSAGLGFSRADRDLNVRRIGWVAAEITRHGGMAVCAPIAPYDEVRREVRAMCERSGAFLLVHVATPLEVCERRDRKGLYAQARAGLLAGLTGVDDPYETPEDADLVLDTSDEPVVHCVQRVLQLLDQRGVLVRPEGAALRSEKD